MTGTDQSNRRRPKLLVALLLAALLAGCGPAASPSAPEATPSVPDATAGPNPLAGSEWTLTALRGSPPLEGTHISLKFEEEWLGGFAGCNTYGGGLEWGGYTATEEGTLTVPMIAMTVMACPSSPESVMEQERTYVETLRGATAYRLDGDRLELQDAAGETVLAYSREAAYDSKPGDLPGTAWQLISMDGRAAVEGSTISLVYHDEHRLSGDAGCRDYVALYEADGDDLVLFFQAMLGPDCAEDRLREREGTYSTLLEGAARYRLAEGQLEILTIRGESLLFEPLPQAAQPTLEGPSWSLLATIEPNPVEGMPAPLPLPRDPLAGTEITLALAGGSAQGSAGCNTYQAAYTLDAASLAFENLAFTERACSTPEGVMAQEGRYLDLLRDVMAYRLYGGQLWLETGDGRALVFSTRASE
jgi:heat shock protein HslJ